MSDPLPVYATMKRKGFSSLPRNVELMQVSHLEDNTSKKLLRSRLVLKAIAFISAALFTRNSLLPFIFVRVSSTCDSIPL
jgi:hypothetical protein